MPKSLLILELPINWFLLFSSQNQFIGEWSKFFTLCSWNFNKVQYCKISCDEPEAEDVGIAERLRGVNMDASDIILPVRLEMSAFSKGSPTEGCDIPVIWTHQWRVCRGKAIHPIPWSKGSHFSFIFECFQWSWHRHDLAKENHNCEKTQNCVELKKKKKITMNSKKNTRKYWLFINIGKVIGRSLNVMEYCAGPKSKKPKQEKWVFQFLLFFFLS